MSVFLGNIHVSPMTRLWSTDSGERNLVGEKDGEAMQSGLKAFEEMHKPSAIDYEESAEDKLEK